MSKFTKNIFLTFLIGCAVYVIGNLLSNGFAYDTVNDFLIDFSFYQLYSFLLGYTNYYYFDYLETLNWTKGERIKRIVIGIVGSVVLTLAGLFLLNAFTFMVYRGYTFEAFLQAQRWGYYSFGLWITLTIVIIFHAFSVFGYGKSWEERKIKELMDKEEQTNTWN